jgi:hypothetical protein
LTDRPSPAALRSLAAFLPRLEQPGFDFGHWVPSTRRADGVLTMPYYELSADGLALVRAMPVQMGFDWPAWMQTAGAKAYFQDHARVGEAPAEDLVKLATSLKRGDRFSEGTLASAFESGLLAAIARRAAVLVADSSG